MTELTFRGEALVILREVADTLPLQPANGEAMALELVRLRAIIHQACDRIARALARAEEIAHRPPAPAISHPNARKG